ncbi:AAA family ATPase [Haloechinothrix salitolerans]|uniref:AAA family ATPase n=1 Tax=Haloechinothrix salitolerans TaxID=926830 RepID=A0ABW2CAH1_9PSEU
MVNDKEYPHRRVAMASWPQRHQNADPPFRMSTSMTSTDIPFADVRETHIAVLFLVGDRVYKLKKPVDVGFLDLRTRERRLVVCRREVELNRRFSPDVYLGLSDVTDVDGEVCDHLVVMRRMPEERRLSTLVAEGEPVADVVGKLARMIAASHAASERSDEITEQGSRDAILGRWRANIDELRGLDDPPVDPVVVDEIEALVEAFLAGREALFATRMSEGRVVDGHGDLLADDIFCLDDGPRVLDCLEFDDKLRWVDGLDDIAFLAMDLERLGEPALADRLLARYSEFAADPAPESLRRHYIAYRAFVRVKVACLRHAQGNTAAADNAKRYAAIAVDHLRKGQVRLVIVGGLPGTGKSTVAGAVADELGAVLLSSDRLRKELAGRNPTDSAASSYGGGIYALEHTERTYDEMLWRARALLARGETVVLDASWHRQPHRDAARAVADETRSELVQLRCYAPTDVTAERMRRRTGSASDADADIAMEMAARTDPWPDAIALDTVKAPSVTAAEALRAVTRSR